MASPSALNLIRAAAVVALAACGALLVDYTGMDPAYCTTGTGCAAVRQSGWGYVPLAGAHVAVPVLGAIAFALLLAVTLLPNERPRRSLSIAGGIGAALIGIALIVIQQLVIGAFCSLCLIADLGAVVAGVGAVLLWRRPAGKEPLEPWAWAALGAIAFGSTWYWPSARPLHAVPAEIVQHYKPGKINVVEFADFECPFCRMLHGTLKKLNEEYAGRVHFVRLNMPLTSHPRALDAARAFVCADEQGKGEIFGDMLFEEELLGKGAQRLAAQRIGLDLDHFRKCLASPATDARINREAKVLRDIGFDGLPTTYVGARRIVGAQPEEVFRDAYSRAAQGGGGGGIPWYVYVMGSLGIAGALVWFGQKQQNGGAASGEAGA